MTGRVLVLGVALVSASLLAGCAGSVVDGTGQALDIVKTSSVPTSAPAATGSPSSTPVEGGFLVTYPAGHLQIVLPAEPVEHTQDGSLGPARFTVNFAVARAATIAEAGAEDITPSLDRSDYATSLHAAVSSFGASSGFTIKSETPTRFRGYVADTATLQGAGGSQYRLLVFMYSGNRLYILFGSDGATYDRMVSSLTLLR
jgi:hypothetical protein